MTYFWNSNSCNPSLIQKILFELKLLSQGSIEQDHLSNNVKKIGSDKKISFSNESVKKTTTYDLLFSIAIYYFHLKPILYAGQKLCEVKLN